MFGRAEVLVTARGTEVYDLLDAHPSASRWSDSVCAVGVGRIVRRPDDDVIVALDLPSETHGDDRDPRGRWRKHLPRR